MAVQTLTAETSALTFIRQLPRRVRQTMGAVIRRMLKQMSGSIAGWCLKLAAAALLSAIFQPFSTSVANAQEATPNVVMIVADDLGWTDAACLGSDYYITPNIDSFRSQSMLIEQFIACPNCAPARAALMSGMCAPRTDMYTVGDSNRGLASNRELDGADNQTYLDTDVTTLGETLQDAGYATGSFGKWHLGSDPNALPTGQGFDVNVGGNHAGGVDSHWANSSGQFTHSSSALPGLTCDPNEYLADVLTDEAIDWMGDPNTTDGPFFAYISHYSVHTPIQAPQDNIDEYDGVTVGDNHDHLTYAAQVNNLDDNVGRVIDYLEDTSDGNGGKLIDNTVVIFVGDNGGVGGYTDLGVPGWYGGVEYTSNAPLAGGKGCLYEGGVRVPMMVRWDGHIDPNSTSDVRASMVDFLPTIADMTGAEMPTGQHVDGESLYDVLTGQRQGLNRSSIYQHFPAYLESDWDGDVMRTTPGSTIYRDQYKLTYYYEDEHLELYDLENDIGEETNLAASQRELAENMCLELAGWLEATDADLPTDKVTEEEVALPHAPDYGEILNPSFENGVLGEEVYNWTAVQTAGTLNEGYTYWQGSGPATLPDGDRSLAICQYGSNGSNASGLYQVIFLDSGVEFDISFWDLTHSNSVDTVTTSTRVFNTDVDSDWVPASESDFLTASPNDGWAVDSNSSTWTEHTSSTLTSNGRLVLTMFSDGYTGDWSHGSRWDNWSIDITEPNDGDADRDGDVDNVDFGRLYGSFTGPGMCKFYEGSDRSDRADLRYDPNTGNVMIDPSEAAGGVITAYVLENLDGLMVDPNETNLYPFTSSTDTTTAYQISQTDLDGDGFSDTWWDLGDIFPTGMTFLELQEFLDSGSYCGTLGTGYFEFDLFRAFADNPRTWSQGDFDGDGDVDNVDFGTLYGDYTGPLAGGMDLQVTPEPAVLALLGIGSTAILRRRRK